MTRPDLDAHERSVDRAKKIRNYGLTEQALDEVLTYCRELEAENKRLREENDGLELDEMSWKEATE